MRRTIDNADEVLKMTIYSLENRGLRGHEQLLRFRKAVFDLDFDNPDKKKSSSSTIERISGKYEQQQPGKWI